MNNVLENNFFSRIGRLINRPKSRFSIEQQHNTAIQFKPSDNLDLEEVSMSSFEAEPTRGVDKFATNFLPTGTLDFNVFRNIVQTESEDSALKDQDSFLVEISLDQSNCSFLTDADRTDLAIDCLKEIVSNGIASSIYTFSPTGKIWLFFTNIPAELAINKANAAFSQAQRLVREELDFHQSLVDLNMYKVQDCLPEIS